MYVLGALICYGQQQIMHSLAKGFFGAFQPFQVIH